MQRASRSSDEEADERWSESVSGRVHEVRSRLRFVGDDRIGLRERESSARWDFERSEYKQKQARNRRQSTQHHATRCAKTSLWLNFSESLSNSAAVKTKNQLNRSEGTKVMVV